MFQNRRRTEHYLDNVYDTHIIMCTHVDAYTCGRTFAAYLKY